MAANTSIVKYTDAYKWVFLLWLPSFPSATTYSFCFPSGRKGRKKEKRRGKKVPLVYETEELSKVHSRESVLPCIQSLKLSVFKGGAVMGPLHGEITCCSPSLKMLTLSLTGDWEQKHMLCARWLNGRVSVLWKRLACICQSSDFALCVYVCIGMCVACVHTHTHIHTCPHFYLHLCSLQRPGSLLTGKMRRTEPVSSILMYIFYYGIFCLPVPKLLSSCIILIYF